MLFLYRDTALFTFCLCENQKDSLPLQSQTKIVYVAGQSECNNLLLIRPLRLPLVIFKENKIKIFNILISKNERFN
jgi:hypothetical protein